MTVRPFTPLTGPSTPSRYAGNWYRVSALAGRLGKS